MKKLFILVSFISIGLAACSSQTSDSQKPTPASENDAARPIFKNIDVAEFKAKMSAPNVVVLDVRTPGEIAAGKIGGAAELDFRSNGFAAGLDQLDKEKTYLVYCRSGNRSGQACALMKEKGFREFYNLKGGYNAWSKE